MGIKDLWTILTPFCERKPLFELQGKTVAIDLSGWVCQAQCITEYQVQPKMYLRNLYFRTCYLLMLGVNPVFVLEGAAPTLKHKTIQSRNAIQFKGAKPRANPGKETTAKGRTRFHHVLKQCEEMLRLMGLSCVTAAGEAEAMCAYLNEQTMVDGCISQDSDCFAYGARIVYRNFSISQQGVSAASGGSVDVYDIRKAEKAIDFGREKVIALSLICGSDYNEGVFGVGKEAAVKLFAAFSNEEILSRIRSWRAEGSYYEKLARDTDIKNNCSQCGHSGNKAKHTRSGCIQCGTSKNCKDLSESNGLNEIRNELNIRKKALDDPNFPDEELIAEFMTTKDKVRDLNLRWRQPDMLNFVKFTVKNLQWEDVYCFEKLFPILTRWCVLNPDNSPIKPKCIKKKRNPKGVGSYEIVWDCECFKIYVEDAESEGKLFSTIEPEDLIQANYPELVERFNESRAKPKSTKRKVVKKTKKKDDGEENGELKKTRKRKADKQKTLTQMLQTNEARVENTGEFAAAKTPQLLNESNLDTSCFGDEDDDADISLVIGGIISQGVPTLIKEKIVEINAKEKAQELKRFPRNDKHSDIDANRYEFKENSIFVEDKRIENNDESIVDDQNVEFYEDRVENVDKMSTSHFFGDVTLGEPDLFERTFNAVTVPSSSESEDSFDEEYVPLLERLQRKL